MKKTITFWVAAITIITILSILISGAIQNNVILPILRFFWLIKGYYGSIHQAIIWGMVITGIVIITILSMRGGSITIFQPKERHPRQPGEVNQMAFWIRSAKRGQYPRWYLARTFADLAIELVRSRGEMVDRAGDIKGPGWNPPDNIKEYLDIALHSTPGTFTRLIESSDVREDPNPIEIINYFESYMEDFND